MVGWLVMFVVDVGMMLKVKVSVKVIQSVLFTVIGYNFGYFSNIQWNVRLDFECIGGMLQDYFIHPEGKTVGKRC